MSDPTEPEPVDAEFEPADDAPHVSAARTSGSMGGYFLTFLIAALAGGGLGGWIAWTLDRTSAGPDDISALETRIAELETAPAPDVFDASGLDARISALETTPLPEQDPVDLTEIEARLEALEAAVAQSDALANQALDQIGNMSGGTDPAILTALEARLSTLESAAAMPGEAVDLSSIEARLAELEAVELPAQVDVAPLEARISALEAASLPDVAGMLTRLDALEARLAESQTQNTEGDISARQLAARSLALVALIEAARSGQPFEAERAALARLWTGQPQLSALAAHARSGVPDGEALSNTYPRQDIEDAIGTNRIFFGLIEVRPSSGSETSPLARIALANERLDRDDLAGAVLLTEQLDGAALEAARSWLVQARARLATDAALDELRAALAAEAEADPT